MKYFQIGFNKCATLSLHYFFEGNGFKSIHYEYGRIACEIRRNVEAGVRSGILGAYEDYDFLCDMEFVCDWDHKYKGVTPAYKEYYKNLDEAYPGSKFILNTRSLYKWLKSRERHAGGEYMKRYMNIYGGSQKDILQLWEGEWYQHHADVTEYFKGRREDLLILDLEAGLDVCRSQLKSFVGAQVDTSHFGHAHKTRAA
ncbi:sulfotransferase [Microbulbifer sp. JTAC008]|uniref:sulfotransferase n=1 Tax=unclassified Microbulbifer TaxID=2619833 RepID=UPI004038FCFE